MSSYSHRFGCNSRALLITNPPNRRKYSENPGPGHDCVDPHAQRASQTPESPLHTRSRGHADWGESRCAISRARSAASCGQINSTARHGLGNSTGSSAWVLDALESATVAEAGGFSLYFRRFAGWQRAQITPKPMGVATQHLSPQ